MSSKPLTSIEMERVEVRKPLIPEDYTVEQQRGDAMEALGIIDDTTRQKMIGRKVTRFWEEKFFLIIDFFQVLALLQYISRLWPWPAAWYHWTWWFVLLDLDVFGWLKGQLSVNYLIYGTIWLVIAFLVMFFTVIFLFTTKMRMLLDNRVFMNAKMLRVVLLIHDVLYLPLAVVSFRLWDCTGGSTLSDDSSVVCFSDNHIILFALSILICVLWLIVIPIMFIRQIRFQSVFLEEIDHEAYLQSMELLYAAGVNNSFINDHWHIISSYRLSSVYYRLYVFAEKFMLAAAAQFLTVYPVIQAGVFVLILSVLFFRMILFHSTPYRHGSTYAILHLLRWIILADAVIGVLVAAKLESPFLLSSAVTIWLWVFNIIGVAGIIMLMSLFKYRKNHWKITNATGIAFYMGNKEDIDSILSCEADLRMNALCYREGGPCSTRILTLTANILNLQRIMKKLTDERSPLMWYGTEILEATVALHKSIRKHASFQPDFPPLVPLISKFVNRLEQRREDLILVHPEVKKILLFLLCARGFIGSRKLQQISIKPKKKKRGEAEEEVPKLNIGENLGTAVVETHLSPRLRDDLRGAGTSIIGPSASEVDVDFDDIPDEAGKPSAVGGMEDDDIDISDEEDNDTDAFLKQMDAQLSGLSLAFSRPATAFRPTTSAKRAVQPAATPAMMKQVLKSDVRPGTAMQRIREFEKEDKERQNKERAALEKGWGEEGLPPLPSGSHVAGLRALEGTLRPGTAMSEVSDWGDDESLFSGESSNDLDAGKSVEPDAALRAMGTKDLIALKKRLYRKLKQFEDEFFAEYKRKPTMKERDESVELGNLYNSYKMASKEIKDRKSKRRDRKSRRIGKDKNV